MPRHPIDLPPDCRQLRVRAWLDPVLDQTGHDPRSPYVERFWLGVLGPSVTWFVRYVADRLDGMPDGFDLDLAACSASLGLGRFQGRAATFPRTLNRCCQFRAARLVDTLTLEVRRKLPPLTSSQLGRLPDHLQLEHRAWVGAAAPTARAHPAALGDQARRLALSLVELGEGPGRVEEQLRNWRFPEPMVREATLWAFEHRGAGLITRDSKPEAIVVADGTARRS